MKTAKCVKAVGKSKK